MPRRKRRSTDPTPAAPPKGPWAPAARDDDAIARFAAALRETEARERADEERRRAERAAAEQLDAARADLARAIERVRAARRAGSGVADADAAWRAAKARVIELETGAPPSWAGDGSTTEAPAARDEERPTDDDATAGDVTADDADTSDDATDD